MSIASQTAFLANVLPVCLVMVACPSVQMAKELSRQIVFQKMAACINVVSGVTSIYEWEGILHEDSEALLMIKTTEDAVAHLTEFIMAHHPYTCPEVIALPVTQGSIPYLNWVSQQVVLQPSTLNDG